LAQQTVVVTGAAQGLGHAIAEAFCQSGSQVIALDIDSDGLASLKETWGAQVICHTVDLAAATTQVIDEIVSQASHIDTLIHNAAILHPEPFETLTFERWQATVNVGLQAAFLLTKAVWPGMKAAGGGVIVYVSSRSGVEGFVDESAYCATKHGLEGLMKALALEGASHNICVCTITPGMYMHTPMSERNYPPELKTRWVAPSALAPAFLKLAERRMAVNGQRLSAWELSQPGE
jgi:NAD(P)-dependent dehydrogenase (short-subunit alcohol dehydrogenase family)